LFIQNSTSTILPTMVYISSLVILFLASYVSVVYADNSDSDNLGPNNVAQIPNHDDHHHRGRKTTTKRPSTGTRPTVASIVTTEVPITNDNEFYRLDKKYS
jgi:hypothetical protein